MFCFFPPTDIIYITVCGRNSDRDLIRTTPYKKRLCYKVDLKKHFEYRNDIIL